MIISLILFLVLQSCCSIHSNKVIELSDKFLEIYKNTTKSWLVKFYSNSCHLSKRLEADYMHVAQMVHEEELNIIVSKVDIYRYRSVARHFGVNESPVILYIEKDRIVRYESNKYKNDLIDFARRMVGDQIRTLSSCEQINELSRRHESAFIYFNPISSFEYTDLAEHHIKNTWFYLCPLNCFGFDRDGVYSIKQSLTNTPYINKYDSGLRISLKQWVDYMYHPKFINITSDNFQKLLDTNKIIVIVLVKKYISIDRFAHPDHKKYFEMFERISHLFLDDYFLFGWTSEFEMVRNVAINSFEQLPTFIVFDSSNYEYYHHPQLINSTQADMVKYLELIKMDRIVEKHGGNTLIHQVRQFEYTFRII